MAVGVDGKPILMVKPGCVAEEYPYLGIIGSRLRSPLRQTYRERMIALLQSHLRSARDTGVLDIRSPSERFVLSRSLALTGGVLRGGLRGRRGLLGSRRPYFVCLSLHWVANREDEQKYVPDLQAGGSGNQRVTGRFIRFNGLRKIHDKGRTPLPERLKRVAGSRKCMRR